MPDAPRPPSSWRAWSTTAFDGRHWPAIAVSPFSIQVVLILTGRAVIARSSAATPLGFFGSIHCFAGSVSAGALTNRLQPKQAACWVKVVSVGVIFTPILHAQLRTHPPWIVYW